jgi:hypothetical protein
MAMRPDDSTRWDVRPGLPVALTLPFRLAMAAFRDASTGIDGMMVG